VETVTVEVVLIKVVAMMTVMVAVIYYLASVVETGDWS